MPNLAPMIWTWTDDGAMCPLSRFRSMCDRELVIGEHYRLHVVEERSEASHSHYFARLHDLWMSLPDEAATQFPTAEMLRKHALIMTGFRRERKFAAASKEEARKLAAFLKPQDLDDDYAIISVNDNVVLEWKPLSQSRKGMPVKGQFYESKTKVLDWIEDLIGVKRSGEARGSQGQAPEDSAAPVTQPLGPEGGQSNGHRMEPNDNIRGGSAERRAAIDSHQHIGQTALGARLRALAERLRKDSPEAFDEAKAALRGTEEAKSLHRLIPKQLAAMVELNEGFAKGRFNERDYQEVLGKILEDAQEEEK